VFGSLSDGSHRERVRHPESHYGELKEYELSEGKLGFIEYDMMTYDDFL